jgi:hypothetical protein
MDVHLKTEYITIGSNKNTSKLIRPEKTAKDEEASDEIKRSKKTKNT